MSRHPRDSSATLEPTPWHWSLEIAPDGAGRLQRAGRMPLADRLLAILGTAPWERRRGWAAHAMRSIASPAERAVASVHAEDLLRDVAGDLAIERVDIVDVDDGRFAVDVSVGGERLRIDVPRRQRDATVATDDAAVEREESRP